MAKTDPTLLRELWLRLALLNVERMKAYFDLKDEFRLSGKENRALLLLEPHLTVSMGEFAALLDCDASTLTRVVNSLESAGLVQRQIDTVDHRITRVSLTDAGQALRERYIGAILENTPLNEFTQEQCLELLEILRTHSSGAILHIPEEAKLTSRR